MWNFTFFSRSGTTEDEDLGKLSLIRILTLCWCCQFPRIWSAGPGATQVFQQVCSWCQENVEEKKFPSPFILSAWLKLIFLRIPYKWMSLSRLKVLGCGHYNSILSLVKLIYFSSLKNKFYSPEASPWAQPSLSHTRSNF